MEFHEAIGALSAIENDADLGVAENVIMRRKALADVAFVLEVADARMRQAKVRQAKGRREDWTAVSQHALSLHQKLSQCHQTLFRKIRSEIQTQQHTRAALRQRLTQFTSYQSGQMHSGEDGLNEVLNGILQLETLPTASVPGTSEMVHLEFAPARAILDMLDQLVLQNDDVFYDLGSGLGHVAILVNLLTGVVCKGVEYDPLFCQMAQQSVQELGLANVHFVAGDARTAVYDDGTIFFMFTPFTGQILADVLARLEVESQSRAITLCTYGTVTLDVAELAWLDCRDPERVHPFKLALFDSKRPSHPIP